MGSKDDELKSQVEAEARHMHQFSIGDIIGREGGDFLKGASAVPGGLRTHAAIEDYLATHLYDPDDALRVVLHQDLDGDLEALDGKPKKAIRRRVEAVLRNQATLSDFVRRVDAEWGRLMDERPFFEREGEAPHPDDPYTNELVRQRLEDLLRSM